MNLPNKLGGNCEFCGTPVCEHYPEVPETPVTPEVPEAPEVSIENPQTR